MTMRKEFDAFMLTRHPKYKPTDDGRITRDDWELWQASAAAERERSKWQPIETAPKDGTVILAFSDGEQMFMEWFSCKEWGGWLYADELLKDVCPDPVQPTHWMEKPEDPPATAIRAKG